MIAKMTKVKVAGSTLNYRILKRIVWHYGDVCLLDDAGGESSAFDPSKSPTWMSGLQRQCNEEQAHSIVRRVRVEQAASSWHSKMNLNSNSQGTR